jgi:cellulose synthase/poly-beta-1,6-N-acetylglucosamine synthase-like glycosyltransferase
MLYFGSLLLMIRGYRLISGTSNQTLTPVVTVIVSFHNEEKNIRELTECLKKIDYPHGKLELLFVNDRSTDDTGELLNKISGELPGCRIIEINDLRDDFAPKKFALDSAIRQAGGEIILLTDADGRPGKDWVHSMVSGFGENVGMVIGYAPYSGRPAGQSFMHQILGIEYFTHAAVAAATAGLGYPATCVGTNLAYRRSLYLQIDGFGPFRHIHTGDDDLFLQRVRDETNWKILYNLDPRSFVPNAPPGTLRQFHNQRIRYASKGFIYPAFFTAALTSFYFFNLLLFAAPLLLVLKVLAPLTVIMILLLKLTADYIFLESASKAFTYPITGWLLPLTSLLHIPYVLYFGLMAYIRRFEWGGVRQRTGI